VGADLSDLRRDRVGSGEVGASCYVGQMSCAAIPPVTEVQERKASW
jgi:hypothetical protein